MTHKCVCRVQCMRLERSGIATLYMCIHVLAVHMFAVYTYWLLFICVHRMYGCP